MTENNSKFGIRPYSTIKISRKIFGLWVEYYTVERYDDDPLVVYHNTRRVFAGKNMRLRLCWEDEIYDIDTGKRLK